jgi:hypothetical protein
MIEQAFFERMEAGNYGLPIAYPAVDFTPPNTGLWLEVKVMRNTGLDDGIAFDSGKIEQGMFQINVCGRPNKGVIVLTNKAQDIIGTFPKGSLIGGVYLNRWPYLMQPIYSDDRVTLPITLPYSQ